MKAKYIKKLRTEINEYNTYWIPLINKTFNVNVTIREVRNSVTYMHFIFNWDLKMAVQETYRLTQF